MHKIFCKKLGLVNRRLLSLPITALAVLNLMNKLNLMCFWLCCSCSFSCWLYLVQCLSLV